MVGRTKKREVTNYKRAWVDTGIERPMETG
jgi:hypothetical protein